MLFNISFPEEKETVVIRTELIILVSLSQQQTGRLRRLIERVRAFSAGCCWGGRPLGSVILWEKHKAALERILQIASSITITRVMYLKNYVKVSTQKFHKIYYKKYSLTKSVHDEVDR